MKKDNVISLPAPVTVADTVRPSYEDQKLLATEDYTTPYYTAYGGDITFELWYTERFGWCIPTLQIANARRGSATRRTYGITLNGDLIRMGQGPHVKATHTVYVRKDRLEALTPFLDRMMEGTEKAGDCRDRISTRRAQTALRRKTFGSAFGWMS